MSGPNNCKGNQIILVFTNISTFMKIYKFNRKKFVHEIAFRGGVFLFICLFIIRNLYLDDISWLFLCIECVK